MRGLFFCAIVMQAVACSNKVEISQSAGATSGAATSGAATSGTGTGGSAAAGTGGATSGSGNGSSTGAGSGGSAGTAGGSGGDAGCTWCDGMCVDLSTDASHCGACGHDCLGAACEDSKCEPVHLIDNQGVLAMMAVANGYVYWVQWFNENGAGPSLLRRMPTSGGTAETVATEPQGITALAANDTHIYWTACGASSALRFMPLSGGPFTTIVEGGELSVHCGTWGAAPMALTPAGVYYRWQTDSDNRGVAVASLDGTTVAPFLKTTLNVMGLAADATSLYVSGDGVGDPHTLRKIPLGGGTVTPISSDMLARGLALVVDDTRAYIAADFGKYFTSVSLATGVVEVHESYSSQVPWLTPAARFVAMDDTHVYWTGFGIERIPKGGGEVESVVYETTPVGIAVDDEAVYWTAHSSGRVMKVAK